MSCRNETNRQRDGNWGAIHDRLEAADTKRRAELDALVHASRGPCKCCGAEVRCGSSGYCGRTPCQRERKRVEYQRARSSGASPEDSRC